MGVWTEPSPGGWGRSRASLWNGFLLGGGLGQGKVYFPESPTTPRSILTFAKASIG